MEGTDVVAAVHATPARPMGQQDLAHLGAVFASAGYTAAEARAMVAQIQETAIQVALAVAPEMLDRNRTLYAGRLVDLMQRINNLPSYMGHVRKGDVMSLVQQAMSTNPSVR